MEAFVSFTSPRLRARLAASILCAIFTGLASAAPDACGPILARLAGGADAAERTAYYARVLERTRAWRDHAKELEAATDPRLRQPFRVQAFDHATRTSHSLPYFAEAWRDARLVVGHSPRGPLPPGARVVRNVSFGYALGSSPFRRLGSLNYVVLSSEGKILEAGGGSPTLLRELRFHVFGRTLSPQEYATIAEVNAKLIAHLRAHPEGQSRLADFAKKRGWPQGLQDEASLAYFDDALTPLVKWAESNGYTLDQMRDAGWVLLKFDPRGQPLYQVSESNVIRIPYFEADGRTIPIWRTRVIQPRTPDSPKYVGWQLDRSIARPAKVAEKLFNGGALAKAKGKTVVITEGEFKCLVATKESGVLTVGLPGITEYDDTIIRGLVDAKAAQYVVILDRDPLGKGLMRVDEITDSERAAYSIALELRRAGAANVKVGVPPDVFEGGKVGIDDLILAKGAEPYHQTIRDAMSPEDYARARGLDPTFQELYSRRQGLRRAVERHLQSVDRDGPRIDPKRFDLIQHELDELNAAFSTYLEREFRNARQIAQPSHNFPSLRTAPNLPEGVRGRLGSGAELPAPAFEGDILLMDFVPGDLKRSACPESRCGQLAFSEADVAKAAQGADSPAREDHAKGLGLAQATGFAPSTAEEHGNVALAGHLAHAFPPDDYRMEFNVTIGSTKIPLVVIHRGKNKVVAMAELKTAASSGRLWLERVRRSLRPSSRKPR